MHSYRINQTTARRYEKMNAEQINHRIARLRGFIETELNFIESRQKRLMRELSEENINMDMVERQKKEIATAVLEIKRYADKIENMINQL